MPNNRPEQHEIPPFDIAVPVALTPEATGSSSSPSSSALASRPHAAADDCDCNPGSANITYDSDSTWSCTDDEDSSSYDFEDDSSFSSIASAELYTYHHQTADGVLFDTTAPTATATRRTVRFAEHVMVREYRVTIGDVPTCRDSCPLTLDWPYRNRLAVLKRSPPRGRRNKDNNTAFTSNDGSLSFRRLAELYAERHGPPQPRLRRLSLEQRRERIAVVQNLSRAEVRAMEIERVLERIADVIQHGQRIERQVNDDGDDNDNSSSNNITSAATIKEFPSSLNHHSGHRLALANVLDELELAASVWSSELRSEAAFCRTKRHAGVHIPARGRHWNC